MSRKNRLVAATRTALVCGNHLDLSVSWDGNVCFEVNQSFFVSCKISVFTGAVILRWAFKAWKDILQELSGDTRFSSKYKCSLIGGDGNLIRRIRALEKVGFHFLDDYEGLVQAFYLLQEEEAV